MELDPITGRSPGATPYPHSSATPLTGREQDAEDVRQLLMRYGKPYGQQYEEWGQEHPILRMGAEIAAERAMPKVMRTLGMAGAAKLLEASRQQYSPISEIKNPKYKWGRVQKSKDIKDRYYVPILDKKEGTRLGSLTIDADKESKTAYIAYWDMPHEEMGRKQLGHLMHIKDELMEKMPAIERVEFFRSKRPDRWVNMPLRRGTGRGVEVTYTGGTTGRPGEAQPGPRYSGMTYEEEDAALSPEQQLRYYLEDIPHYDLPSYAMPHQIPRQLSDAELKIAMEGQRRHIESLEYRLRRHDLRWDATVPELEQWHREGKEGLARLWEMYRARNP